ncbi:cation-translocating P-type ATPase [Salegentibacter sp. LM13S]|uniref:cation-translocating P-type ATPase n=1 Tax=Salegentibacter lacus TaxID=2873599 RepID=UPI001CCD4BCC|nr:cation-translocating P-type ATPase [Salegentibacter lacus]MBZ9630092.1 cation-translocating P-type ATPase [Salegentibacter lacus]
MSNFTTNFKGLTSEAVKASAESDGYNQIESKKKSGFFTAIQTLITEPMIILLFVAAIIYFLTGNPGDGLFLSFAILLVAGISLFQETRSRNALKKLKEIIQPETKVIRNNKLEKISASKLVLNDIIVVEEGSSVPADATILQSNDFSVNEAVLTGESFSVSKQPEENPEIYMGTQVVGGLAVAKVTAIGNKTRLGKIGKSMESQKHEKTLLEKQINNFVKKMVIAGSFFFLLVWILNYLETQSILESLLQALTLAMSILPEEIPVAFATFMAMGAWRLMKMGIVVKQMKTVESLGSASVICADKTGTITQNKMSLAKIVTSENWEIQDLNAALNTKAKRLLEVSMWASEPIPFDPMEIAIHNTYDLNTDVDLRKEFKMIHEYPLSGKPPMMTHIFENNLGKRIIAAKGAPEALLKVSDLDERTKELIEKQLNNLASEGFRVLGVGEVNTEIQEFPEIQQDLKFKFLGLIAFYDPPKENISKVFEDFYSAGLQVKIITGDNAKTTAEIARQINFKNAGKSMDGEELLKLSDEELKEEVKTINIFTRMFPEAKLKIINALKANNEIVAMTGDGVNDGPALKAAHIGIAMGKRGSELAKEAASLILIKDDLSGMVDAVEMGRRIYNNLKKAIQYIISIHIPIILTVFIPLALGWIYPNIFSPVHIIFLELIMGPTCSIIYENEPAEANILKQKPRPVTQNFFNIKELSLSVIQGIGISVGTLGIYRFAVFSGFSEDLTRSMVFSCLIAANIFLTLVNRSFLYSAITTLSYKNRLIPIIIGITTLLSTAMLYWTPLRKFFEFGQISLKQLLLSLFIGFLSVIWIEGYKFYKRRTKN